MPRLAVLSCLLGVLLGACSSAQYVTGDSRDMFDTAKGMYGGNEFGPRSTEGKITVANDPASGSAPAPSVTAPATAPVTAPVAAAAPVTVAAAAAAPALAAGADAAIAIDAYAYAAVFGTAASPIRPNAEQLLRLDSLALVAADSARIDLQTKILACRRAGEACRIAHR